MRAIDEERNHSSGASSPIDGPKNREYIPCLGHNDVVEGLMPVAEARQTDPDHHIDSSRSIPRGSLDNQR